MSPVRKDISVREAIPAASMLRNGFAQLLSWETGRMAAKNSVHVPRIPVPITSLLLSSAKDGEERVTAIDPTTFSDSSERGDVRETETRWSPGPKC